MKVAPKFPSRDEHGLDGQRYSFTFALSHRHIRATYTCRIHPDQYFAMTRRGYFNLPCRKGSIKRFQYRGFGFQENAPYPSLQMLRKVIAFRRWLTFSSLFVDWEVYLFIPRYATCASAIAHDARALAARQTGLL